jgi:hypothetical protein
MANNPYAISIHVAHVGHVACFEVIEIVIGVGQGRLPRSKCHRLGGRRHADMGDMVGVDECHWKRSAQRNTLIS